MSQNKTEQPTPKRLRKAREDGDSGASPYAAQAVGFLCAVALLPAAAAALASFGDQALRAAIARATVHPAPVSFDTAELEWKLVALVGPVILAAAVAASATAIVQTGGNFSVGKLAPKLERLDVVEGWKRLWSADRLFAVLRALVGTAVVVLLAYRALHSHVVDLSRLSGRLGEVGRVAGELSRGIVRDAALAGLAVAVLDVVIVRRSWQKRLMMTKEEVRREYKESEGDPQMKAARERAHQEVLAAATIANVKTATVVVVNPTHIACALRYDEKDEEGAPTVVASGEGDLAERIVRAAHDYGVPVVRDVPLARALRELAVGDVIPEALYEAVAEILREAWEEEGKG